MRDQQTFKVAALTGPHGDKFVIINRPIAIFVDFSDKFFGITARSENFFDLIDRYLTIAI